MRARLHGHLPDTPRSLRLSAPSAATRGWPRAAPAVRRIACRTPAPQLPGTGERRARLQAPARKRQAPLSALRVFHAIGHDDGVAVIVASEHGSHVFELATAFGHEELALLDPPTAAACRVALARHGAAAAARVALAAAARAIGAVGAELVALRMGIAGGLVVGKRAP